MQDLFVTTKHQRKIIPSIISEIKTAIRLNNYIVIVYMPDCGDILPEILNIIHSYNKTIFVSKYDQDGGTEVLTALKRKNHLKFCGIYTSQCVHDTVQTIAESYPKNFRIELLENACGDQDPVRNLNGIRSLAMCKRISII